MAKELRTESVFEEETDFEFDMVRGSHGKKPKLSALNKKVISSHEMDELFLDLE